MVLCKEIPMSVQLARIVQEVVSKRWRERLKTPRRAQRASGRSIRARQKPPNRPRQRILRQREPAACEPRCDSTAMGVIVRGYDGRSSGLFSYAAPDARARPEQRRRDRQCGAASALIRASASMKKELHAREPPSNDGGHGGRRLIADRALYARARSKGGAAKAARLR